MKFVAALVPSLGMLLVGAVVLRAVIYGDRRERDAQKDWEAQHDAPGTPAVASVSAPDDSVTTTQR